MAKQCWLQISKRERDNSPSICESLTFHLHCVIATVAISTSVRKDYICIRVSRMYVDDVTQLGVPESMNGVIFIAFLTKRHLNNGMSYMYY